VQSRGTQAPCHPCPSLASELCRRCVTGEGTSDPPQPDLRATGRAPAQGAPPRCPASPRCRPAPSSHPAGAVATPAAPASPFPHSLLLPCSLPHGAAVVLRPPRVEGPDPREERRRHGGLAVLLRVLRPGQGRGGERRAGRRAPLPRCRPAEDGLTAAVGMERATVVLAGRESPRRRSNRHWEEEGGAPDPDREPPHGPCLDFASAPCLDSPVPLARRGGCRRLELQRLAHPPQLDAGRSAPPQPPGRRGVCPSLWIEAAQ
jgi:hypothetical protein